MIDGSGRRSLPQGSFVGFPAGQENAHHLCNESESNATYLAIGSCLPGKDVVHYPDDGFGPVRR